MNSPSFSNVTVDAKANVYFEGKVVSHTVRFADRSKKTIGLIYAGEYHFGTGAPERMEIIEGNCSVVLDGTHEALEIKAGSHFDVPGNSGFTITVKGCICEYVCSFLS
jgi:uncharacterized protein YaiE (UPF0345 family)